MNGELVHTFDHDFPINDTASNQYLSCQHTALEGMVAGWSIYPLECRVVLRAVWHCTPSMPRIATSYSITSQNVSHSCQL